MLKFVTASSNISPAFIKKKFNKNKDIFVKIEFELHILIFDLKLAPMLNVTTIGMEKLLLNLKVSKVAGPDKLSGKLLKATAQEIAPVLLDKYCYPYI